MPSLYGRTLSSIRTTGGMTTKRISLSLREQKERPNGSTTVAAEAGGRV